MQLRPDNKEKTLYNMVGFQTKMKYASQVDVFKKIPGMENVQFARLGGIHRNTFINTPHLLSNELSLKNASNIYFAGQITGVEGYVESTAIGLLVSYFIDQKIKNKKQLYMENDYSEQLESPINKGDQLDKENTSEFSFPKKSTSTRASKLSLIHI